MLLKFIFLWALSQLFKAQGDVTFRLYTRSNADTYVSLLRGKLQGDTINVTKPFKFIIHGYTSSADSDWVKKIKDAYLTKGDYNVVEVDWKSLADQRYDDSAKNTREVGKSLSDLIIDFYHRFGLSLLNVHLIGHSLGAHVAGFAGQNIISALDQKVARITGLDAAGPLFYGCASNERLSVGDANFIDCVHTDDLIFGYRSSLAHADFYPNGGIALQPGCFTSWLIKLDPVTCSHRRSYEYYTESINSNAFMSKKCYNNWNYITGQCKNNPTAIMGENVDESTRGNYYLTTNSRAPYGKGPEN